MIEMTEALLKLLDEQHGQPLRLVDPRSGVGYVLLRADLLERMDTAEDDEFKGIDVGALMDAAMSEDDENDPHLESYQQSEGLA